MPFIFHRLMALFQAISPDHAWNTWHQWSELFCVPHWSKSKRRNFSQTFDGFLFHAREILVSVESVQAWNSAFVFYRLSIGSSLTQSLVPLAETQCNWRSRSWIALPVVRCLPYIADSSYEIPCINLATTSSTGDVWSAFACAKPFAIRASNSSLLISSRESGRWCGIAGRNGIPFQRTTCR